MAKLNRQQAFALAGEREWMDIPEQLGEDSNKILSSALGSLDNSIVGDVLRAVKGKPFRQQVEMVLSRPDISQKEKDRIASEYLNADTILQQGQKALKDYSQFWAKRKSKKSQAADKYVAEAEGDNELEKGLNTIGRYIENPATIGLQTIGQLPQLLAPAGLAVGLRTKSAQALLQKAGVSTNAATGLGSLGYQVNVGGQQAREQSLEDSADNRPLSEEERKAFDDPNYKIDPTKINKNAGEANRYKAADIATDTASKISAAAGLIGLKSDLALTNLLMGESIKGLSKQGLKAAGGHLAKNIAEETVDESGSPLGANIGAQQTYAPKRDTFKDVGKQAAAGAVLGAGMGSVQAGSLYLFGDGDKNEAPTADDLAQSILNSVPKQDIPKQYQDAFNAFEDAKQTEAQAQAAHEANPTPESEDALNAAIDERARANHKFTQYDAAFKQSFTEQEQKDLLANDLKGIAARAKLAEEAKQAELNSKAEQEALAKAQRANMVKGLSEFADNEEVLLNEVNQLGLDDTQKELLLREVYAERKNAKSKPQQANGQPKTPLELAVDEHFDAKGNRKQNVMSSDVADKHKVSLNELLPAIAKRNNDIKIQKTQAERQAKIDAFNKSQAQQKTKDVQREKLTEQQQLENTLAELAAENDTSSMLSMLEGYDKTEADKLFNNAFKTVETRAKEAEKATKAKEAEANKQAQAKQKQSVFNADMAALYESNPNATYSDWKNVGKKHGVTSAIDLANAWASLTSKKPVKNQEQAKPTEPLTLPAPNNVMVTDAQGNTTQTTENNVPQKPKNQDVSVPSGLKVDVSNAANTQRDRGVGSYSGSASNLIVRQDGKPFPTEQVAQQALANKATKKTKPKKNEPVITKDTHTVVPVDGGYAIAPVEDIKQEPVSETKVEQPIVDNLSGDYAHSQFPDATATVTKTEKGYDINWGDEVQSFTGKNAVEKTQAALKKEGFNKKNPDDDNGGVPVEPVAPKPVSPTGGNSAPQAKPKTDAKNGLTEKEYSKTEKEYSKSTGQQQADAPVKWFATELRAKEWINKQKSGNYKIVKVNNNKFEIYAADENSNQKSPLKATASKSDFNKAFGVNESKIDEIAKDFERKSQNESEQSIGKNSEGKDLYEDSRGVRYYKQGGAKVFEDVAIGQGNAIGAVQRTDEYRTVEEVDARKTDEETKQTPTENTIFTKDAADAARARLKKKLGGNQLYSGFDPEILQDGLILAGYHIEKGARTFAAFAKAIVEDMGDIVKPYIKSWYMGVKYDPRAANFDGMSSAAEVDSANIEEILSGANKIEEFKRPVGWEGTSTISTKKGIDGGIIDRAIKTDNKKPDEWFVIPNNDFLTSQFKGKFFASQKDAFDAFESALSKAKKPSLSEFFAEKINQGQMPKDNRQLKDLYLDYFGIDTKDFGGLEQKQAQEALELAIVQSSRAIIDRNKNGTASTYNELVDLYNSQPNLNTRTSTSIANQAYSTPSPLAYIAATMAGIDKNTMVYEPTAGNGMLLITASPKNITANELNKERYDNLKSSIPSAKLTQGDALTAVSNNVVAEKSQDAVITNPPFGALDSKAIFEGYKIGKIDHLITLESLKAIKDNGSAAIIIGADMVAGLNKSDDVIFLNYLYSNYNVISHFEVDGSLYSRQGASWPVRVIIVKGRKKSNKTAPLNGAIKRIDSWGEIYEQYKILDANNNRGLSSVSSSENNVQKDDSSDISGGVSSKTGFLNQSGREPNTNTDDVRGTSPRNVSNGSKPRQQSEKQDSGISNDVRPDERTNAQDNLAIGDNRDSGKSGRNANDVRGTKPDGVVGDSALALESEDNQFQVKYTPASSRKDEGVLVPVNMRKPLMEGLDVLADNVGDIDQYATKELGYKSVDELHDKLMGLQVDSVASAIYQIKEKGKGIIIADQTGIGKGRQAASIIRWAERNDYVPVFVTVKPQLFTDMYYDLDDIGSKDIKPFIFNDQGGEVVLKDNTRLFKTKPSQRTKLLDNLAAGEMPNDTNAIFLTYSQINKVNRQQMALNGISNRAVFILDESHNAGGMSATGLFMQDVLANAAGVVYLSATYAKRPDNMPVYFKTDMGLSADESSDIAQAMQMGGLPLQTIISNMLVKSGQLFRRERSYDGVNIETVVDTKNKAKHKKISDQITTALRAIVRADSVFHSNYEKIAKDLAQAQGMDVKSAGNKASDTVTHTEFSSIVHNFIRQLLLGLKVDEAANEAISALKQGKKPLIAVENTMGSFLNDYAAKNALNEGDSLTGFGYRTVLKRALDRTRFVKIKDDKGEETTVEVPLNLLDNVTRQFYDEAESIIRKSDLDGIPASPIDWMRYRIAQAGFSVSEITGRNLAVDYSKETPVLSKVPLNEQNDKVGTTRLFNEGRLDAIILNVSGSTGISLHASEKFKDQRPRHMIIAQPAQDINIFMQMLGRIHRTGQVVLPSYTILSLDLPTEKRPTAVLNKKMRSLNANTSSNTDSATSIKAVDMLNKYGDKIFAEFLLENKDISRAIGINVSETIEQNIDLAKKASGRMALLPIDKQQKIYDEIEPQYTALIDYLNETNQNELEPKAIDFEAELLKETTIVAEVDKSTPFGGEAVLGVYKVKPQGEPMTIEQIKALAVKNIGEGVSGTKHAQNLIEQNKPYFDAYLETFKAKTKDAEDIADAETSRAKQTYSAEQTQSMLMNYRVGTGWIIDIKGELYNSVITNVRTSYKKGGAGNPFSPSKWIVSLAVNGALRSITLPLTEFNRISQGVLHGDLTRLMQKRPDDSSSVKIITGNLLAAYTKLKDADGRVITFTKKDKATEQGILLPKSFKIEANIRHDLPLKESSDVITVLDSSIPDIDRFGVSTRKYDLSVFRKGDKYIIRTPKSKATGGKWYLNKNLLDVVGDFASQDKTMSVSVGKDKIKAALDVILQRSPLYVLPSMAEDAQALINQDTDNKPKFSQSSAIGDRTTTQVRDKLISRFGKRIIEQLENKGILKIHQSMNTLPKGVLDMARGSEDAAYYNGVVHLIADNLIDENIIPAFVHDLSGHKGFQEMMSPKAYELIMQQFYRLVAKGNPIALKAKQRAERAEVLTDKEKEGKTDKQIKELEAIYEARQKNEYLPYLLTEQVHQQQTTPQERNAVKRLIDHIVRAVKGLVVRTLSKYNGTAGIAKRVSETLDARDIQLMAERMIKDIAKYSGDNNRPKFSQLNALDSVLSGKTSVSESGMDGWSGNAKLVSNIFKSRSFQLHGFGGLDAPTQRIMLHSMLGMGKDREILNSIINFIPIEVVNILRNKKLTPDMLFHNESVLKKSLTVNSDRPISFVVDVANALAIAITRMSTEYLPFIALNKVSPFKGDSSTSFTGNRYAFAATHNQSINNNEGQIIPQIKATGNTGNNGEFSPTNPDIRFSRGEEPSKAKQAADYVLDSVRISQEAKANLVAKAELGWWHKTFGTQLNTAKLYSDFGRVYEYLQRLLQRTNSDVMDALEVAPTLLEKLDDLHDLGVQAKAIGTNIHQYLRKKAKGTLTDREAVAKVIFGETLAKEPLSREELEQKLTKPQIQIYEEARAAIDVSLKNTAKSEIIRSLLQNKVINFDTVERHLNQRTGYDEFIDEMLENIGARISNAQEELKQAETDVEKQAIEDELKRLSDMYNSVSNVNKKVYKLIKEGYAPLMRFGDYTLTMRDKETGKVMSFMMFESKSERTAMVNHLAKEYGDTVILTTDMISKEGFKEFKGITPETLALFAKEIGISQDEATQAYLKLAIPATSALTRRIHRKGTAGYNEDIQRVMASFVMSNARYSAKNIYLDKVNNAISDITSGESVRDQAKKMRDNTINPAEHSALLRDILFLWNLGGSPFFALLNLTQPFMQTIPMLSQYVNTGFAAKHILRGIKVAGAAIATGKPPKGYEAEYERAVHEGIVDPQNTFMLTGLERGGTGATSKAWTATKHTLGLFAQMSESINRKATLIAALEVANKKGDDWIKSKGYESAYDFAKDVISQTQGVYNKANRSNWAHTALGAPLLVFKQFSINYVEQYLRMWRNKDAGEEGKKAAMLMLLLLFSLAGGLGLPFVKDVIDGSETIASFAGRPVNVERWLRTTGNEYFGETATDAMLNGIINRLVLANGLGIDVQSRTGMGDLVPMTNVFNQTLSSSERTNEMLSVFGAAGGLGEKVGDSIQLMAKDEYKNAAVTLLPRFASSMYRGYEMMTEGKTTDSKDRMLFDTTMGEGIAKFLDANPARMAELSRARGLEYNDIAIQRSKIDYYRSKWIKAAQKGDDDAIEKIEQDIEEWNENNEKYPVIFDRQRAYEQANKASMTWGEREEKPRKGMEWLQEERPDWLNEQ